MKKLRKGSSWGGDEWEDVKQDEMWFRLGLKEVQIQVIQDGEKKKVKDAVGWLGGRGE